MISTWQMPVFPSVEVNYLESVHADHNTKLFCPKSCRAMMHPYSVKRIIGLDEGQRKALLIIVERPTYMDPCSVRFWIV